MVFVLPEIRVDIGGVGLERTHVVLGISSYPELLIGVHGLIDAVYWRELGQKTHRGMQGLALRGLHTGGRCVGYTSVKNADGSAELEVNKEQAEIVQRIFRLCAEGNPAIRSNALLTP